MSPTCKKPLSPAHLLEIQPDHDGQRIDNFLVTHLKGVPKSHIYRILRKGEVRVNKGRIGPDYRLCSGDNVRIPPLQLPDSTAPVSPGSRTLELIKSSVIYEDKGLLILNKPSGIAVHGGSGLSYGMIEALRALHPDAPFLELVHRLDRDTSGCLMIAKKRSTLHNLHGLLRSADVDKRYLTLVKGRWQGGERAIEASLRKHVLSSGERMVKVSEDGKQALSLFQPRTLYSGASLMQVRLMSGRTHQIRVHAAHCGHPIAGDEKYGDGEFNRRLRSLGLRRLFLHAVSLTFHIPETGQKIHVSAPLSSNLKQLLTKLEEQYR